MHSFIRSKNAISFFIAFTIFLVLLICLKINLLQNLDALIYNSISPIICVPVTAFFIFITTIGGEYALVTATAFLLAFFRKNKFAILISLNLLITFLLNVSLKLIIARPRPPIENMLKTANGYSFPSGHSMCSMVFFGTIICFIFLYLKSSKLKNLLILMLSLLILLIGFSRIYLGAHYFSDVLAGFSLGIAILSIFSYLYKQKNYKFDIINLKKH